jgi:hypothetical protein
MCFRFRSFPRGENERAVLMGFLIYLKAHQNQDYISMKNDFFDSSALRSPTESNRFDA